MKQFLSSDYKLKILRKAKDEGYFIKCIFVLTVNPLINVARVQARVADGGHDVDRDKITKRYYKSIGNIKQLIDICDINECNDEMANMFRVDK